MAGCFTQFKCGFMRCVHSLYRRHAKPGEAAERCHCTRAAKNAPSLEENPHRGGGNLQVNTRICLSIPHSQTFTALHYWVFPFLLFLLLFHWKCFYAVSHYTHIVCYQLLDTTVFWVSDSLMLIKLDRERISPFMCTFEKNQETTLKWMLMLTL